MVELEDGSLLGLSYNKVYKSLNDGLLWVEDSSYNLKINNYVGNENEISKSKEDELVISDNQNSYYLDNKGYNYTFEMPVLEPGVSEIVQFGEKIFSAKQFQIVSCQWMMD